MTGAAKEARHHSLANRWGTGVKPTHVSVALFVALVGCIIWAVAPEPSSPLSDREDEIKARFERFVPDLPVV